MEKPEKIKVLYIDDEPNNLLGFKATFRLDYNVLLAGSASEGKQILDANPDVKIILCDQRMPGETGVQFFEEITFVHPAPVRMLLTGYTDIESVINAINHGHIYRYISKPWQESDIRSAIEEGYKYYTTTSMLKVKNEELEKAYDELDKFAYSVTHDMRGPIVSMLGVIEIAKSTDDLNDLRDLLGMMEKAIYRVDDFIKRMHEYYKLKRGSLEIENVQFKEMMVGISELYKMSVKTANVDFKYEVQQDEIFRSDKRTIEIILNNLLSNAFKYQRNDNDAKFVHLNINVNKGVVKIKLEDNGIGIEDVHLKSVFNMFYRANTEKEGSGFGLYNVKNAIQKLNGDIQVESVLGKGTVFQVTIPSK